MVLPMNWPNFCILLLERSMHLILVILNISSISYWYSSVIPLFLSDIALMQGRRWRPSMSSFMPDRENLLYFNPDKSIFSIIWWGYTVISFFFLSPFLGGSPFGSLSYSTLSPNVTYLIFFSFSSSLASSPMILSSPSNYPKVVGISILLPVSFSYLLWRNSMIFFYSSNFV